MFNQVIDHLSNICNLKVIMTRKLDVRNKKSHKKVIYTIRSSLCPWGYAHMQRISFYQIRLLLDLYEQGLPLALMTSPNHP